MNVHIVFDFISYAVGAYLSLKVFRPKSHFIESESLRYLYYTVAISGAFFGAFVLGTLNLYVGGNNSSYFILGKSILGAIVGAIITIEVFKKIFNISGSTGSYFVPSLVAGIVIGRVGCFLSGLDDYTYGVVTESILGYDFGDHLPRHPVQLYESFTMLIFFLYVLFIYVKDIKYFRRNIFYQFALVYGLQRFIWEFLKPYNSLALGLNIFQWVCLGLVIYAISKIKCLYKSA